MFERRVVDAGFLSPLRDFALETQGVEYRRDPLLPIWCRVNVMRASRVKQGQTSGDYSELIEGSTRKCYFCRENIPRDTPKFPPSIAGEGRLRLGECTVFPNLFPFAQYHAIATITDEHFRPLDGFTVPQVADALKGSMEYFRRVHAQDKEAVYPSLNWNHLPPSGASIVHPHLQLVVDRMPTYLTKALLEAGQEYYHKKGENYWLRLVEEEKKAGERFIGSTDGVAWIASFAPLGNKEVIAVFTDSSSLLELDEDRIKEFSEGVLKILGGYARLGVRSFNMSTYSAPVGYEGRDFRLTARIISRPPPQRYYTSDAGFMETMHRERIVEFMPEALAEELRKFF